MNKYQEAHVMLTEMGMDKPCRKALDVIARAIENAWDENPMATEIDLRTGVRRRYISRAVTPYEFLSWICPRPRKSESKRGFHARLRAWMNLWWLNHGFEWADADEVDECPLYVIGGDPEWDEPDTAIVPAKVFYTEVVIK